MNDLILRCLLHTTPSGKSHNLECLSSMKQSSLSHRYLPPIPINRSLGTGIEPDPCQPIFGNKLVATRYVKIKLTPIVAPNCSVLSLNKSHSLSIRDMPALLGAVLLIELLLPVTPLLSIELVSCGIASPGTLRAVTEPDICPAQIPASQREL